jgi:hypothetical protein
MHRSSRAPLPPRRRRTPTAGSQHRGGAQLSAVRLRRPPRRWASGRHPRRSDLQWPTRRVRARQEAHGGCLQTLSTGPVRRHTRSAPGRLPVDAEETHGAAAREHRPNFIHEHGKPRGRAAPRSLSRPHRETQRSDNDRASKCFHGELSKRSPEGAEVAQVRKQHTAVRGAAVSLMPGESRRVLAAAAVAAAAASPLFVSRLRGALPGSALTASRSAPLFRAAPRLAASAGRNAPAVEAVRGVRRADLRGDPTRCGLTRRIGAGCGLVRYITRPTQLGGDTKYRYTRTSARARRSTAIQARM